MALGPREKNLAITPAQWQAVKDLFDRALDQAAEARPAFLQSANPDTAVRSEVHRLLAHWEGADSFVERAGRTIFEAAVAPAFSPGDLLANRYLIVRFIARGGMGEVYEAEDQTLSGKVALKILSPALALDPRLEARFRKEILLARNINSPYVCRVHDIDYHEDEDGTKTTFYTMELLEGETLAARLKAKGKFTLEEARPIIHDMALGLDAAHKLGVIHRDFKPGNVILTPKGAVITDFGLAQELADGTDSLRAATISYAAPEQLAGGEQTTKVDIYSLGLVVRNMLTGNDPNGNPVGLPATVRKCLEIDPADRPISAVKVAESLKAFEQPGPFWDRRKVGLMAGSAVVIGTIGAGVYKTSKSNSTTGITKRHDVAVLPFQTADPALQYLSVGLSDRLRDFLGQIPGLRIAARFTSAKVAAAKADSLAKIGQDLNAVHILAGEIRRNGQNLQIQIELLVAEMGSQIVSRTYDVTEAVAPGLYVDFLRLALPYLGGSASAATKAENGLSRVESVNRKILMARFFVDRREQDSLQLAIQMLNEVVAEAPDFSPAYSSLALAWYHFVPRSGLPRNESIAKVEQFAREALRLEPQNAEAYFVYASLQYMYLYQWKLCESNLNTALAINPSLAAARQLRAALFNTTGRFAEAMDEINLAIRFDPQNQTFGNTKGNVYAFSGRLNEAIEEFKSVQAKDPAFVSVYGLLPLALAQVNRFSEAIRFAQQGVSLSRRASFMLGVRAYCSALSGDIGTARTLMGELNLRLADHRTDQSILAQVAVALRQHDYAISLLEDGSKAFDVGINTLRSQAFQPLRVYPRFTALATRVNLHLQ